MLSTTASNPATPQQQVDALMLALRSREYWVSGWVSKEGTEHELRLYENQNGRVGSQLVTLFKGTQEEVIKQLIAHQVAERLAG